MVPTLVLPTPFYNSYLKKKSQFYSYMTCLMARIIITPFDAHTIMLHLFPA